MFRSERVLRIICFEPVFLAFNPGGCPQSHTGQGFSSCVFSCQHAKKSIVLGHFSFQFELWFFLIWSWSIPVGASETRCSTRVFAVSKTAATDHSRHESTKCEQDSKSVCGDEPHVGSNPTVSARCKRTPIGCPFVFLMESGALHKIAVHFPAYIIYNIS